jgi:hypothetical protein
MIVTGNQPPILLAMVPAYNKGSIMMVSKEYLKQGAGRKI